MDRMPEARVVWMLMAGLVVGSRATADETVVLQTTSGRLLQATADGTLRADRFLPGPRESFTLVGAPDGKFAIKTSDGRVGAVMGVASPQQFSLVPVQGNRVALRGPTGWLVVDATAAASAAPSVPDQPGAEHTIELFRLGQVPSLLQEELGRMIRKAVIEELSNKGYERRSSPRYSAAQC